ncbi:MAG: U32 family peptidase [Bacteroidales bacterium]|nr:U32 family peptidase [Bacteroidales bacterium]
MQLELLAPARTRDIGIAAIDCGADAVYIAGPAFGARYAAGNGIGDIAELCSYAHRFKARVYATVNTLLEENERPAAEKMMQELYEAGIDAFIVQDPAILALKRPPVPLFASTQSVLRTPERAQELEKAGFSRLILERQLSLEQIRAIRNAVKCDLEFFVHGALCVCYSGHCYLSEELLGRSANRGCCAQPCRSTYDLTDADGRILARQKSLLSLKDFRLDDHIAALIGAGISSFKIEGRLKNASYVKNIVRHYDKALNAFIEANPGYSRSSIGRCSGGFEPDPEKTFNRGYTSLFIDGKRGKWNSADSAKAIGEPLGTISQVKGNTLTLALEKGKAVANGDGLTFISNGVEVAGMRAEVARGIEITVREASPLKKGMKVYRNFDLQFDRELEKNMPQRLVEAAIDYSSNGGRTTLCARTAEGTQALISFEDSAELARNTETAEDAVRRQLGKKAGIFDFKCGSLEWDEPRFYPASQLNAMRRDLADKLQETILREAEEVREKAGKEALAATSGIGAAQLTFPRPPKGEVMRTKYCIRHELGFCPKQKPSERPKEPLYLCNSGYRLKLEFDCKNCEMIVIL